MNRLKVAAIVCLALGGCTTVPMSNAGYANANNNIADHGLGIGASSGGATDSGSNGESERADTMSNGGVIWMPGQGGDGEPQPINSLPPGAWKMP